MSEGHGDSEIEKRSTVRCKTSEFWEESEAAMQLVDYSTLPNDDDDSHSLYPERTKVCQDVEYKRE
jgi:hypothetical protein